MEKNKNVSSRVAKYTEPIKKYLEQGHTAKEISGMMGVSYVTVLKYIKIIKEDSEKKEESTKVIDVKPIKNIKKKKLSIISSGKEVEKEEDSLEVEPKKTPFNMFTLVTINGEDYRIRVLESGRDIWYSYDDLDKAFSQQGYNLKELEVPYIEDNGGETIILLWDVVYLSKVAGDIYFRESMKNNLFGISVFGEALDFITAVSGIDSIIRSISETKNRIDEITNAQDDLMLSYSKDNDEKNLKQVFDLISLKTTLKKQMKLVEIITQNINKSTILWADILDFSRNLSDEVLKYHKNNK